MVAPSNVQNEMMKMMKMMMMMMMMKNKMMMMMMMMNKMKMKMKMMRMRMRMMMMMMMMMITFTSSSIPFHFSHKKCHVSVFFPKIHHPKNLFENPRFGTWSSLPKLDSAISKACSHVSKASGEEKMKPEEFNKTHLFQLSFPKKDVF